MGKLPRINLELPEDVHRLVRAAAALSGRTLQEWVPEALEVAAKEVLASETSYEHYTKPAKRSPRKGS